MSRREKHYQNRLREMTPEERRSYYSGESSEFPPSSPYYWSGDSYKAKGVPPMYPVFENYGNGNGNGKYSNIPGGELTVEVEDEELGVPGPEDIEDIEDFKDAREEYSSYSYYHPYWWGPYYYNPKRLWRWKYYKKPFLWYYYQPSVYQR